jgi:hypothetical protein
MDDQLIRFDGPNREACYVWASQVAALTMMGVAHVVHLKSGQSIALTEAAATPIRQYLAGIAA